MEDDNDGNCDGAQAVKFRDSIQYSFPVFELAFLIFKGGDQAR